MPMRLGFQLFYDLNSGPILALPRKLCSNAYYQHGIAKCHIPHLHIDLKLLHFLWFIVQNVRVDHISGNIPVSYRGNLV